MNFLWSRLPQFVLFCLIPCSWIAVAVAADCCIENDGQEIGTFPIFGTVVRSPLQKKHPRPQHICRFKIVDEQKNPVVEAKVRFFQISPHGSYSQLESAQSNSQGYLDVEASELFGRDREFVLIAKSDEGQTGAIYRFGRPEKIKSWTDSQKYVRQLASNSAADSPVMSVEIVLKSLMNIEGTVVDRKTMMPLAGAKVRLTQKINYEGTERGASLYASTLTDQNGNYSFGGYSEIPKTISVLAKNYRSYRNGVSDEIPAPMDGDSILKHMLVHKDVSHGIDPVVENQFGKRIYPTKSFKVTVVDYDSGEPIAGAKVESRVKLDGHQVSLPMVTTNLQGIVKLNEVPKVVNLEWKINHDGYRNFGWRPAYLKDQEFELLSDEGYQRLLRIGQLQLPDTSGMTELQTIRRLAKSFERSEHRSRVSFTKPSDPMKRFVYSMKLHPSPLYLERIEAIAFPDPDQPNDREAQFEALRWLFSNEHHRTRNGKKQRLDRMVQVIERFTDHPGLERVFVFLSNEGLGRKEFFTKVAELNPNRTTRGNAIYELAQLNRTISRFSGNYESHSPDDVKSWQEKQRRYLEQLLAEFGDAKYASSTLGKVAKRDLIQLDQFGIGGTPPNLAIVASKNQKLKLHDLRGRFTLIHYWNGRGSYPDQLLPLTQSNKKIQLVTVVYGISERVEKLTANWSSLVIVDPAPTTGEFSMGWMKDLKHYAKDQRNILIDPTGKVVSAKLSPEKLYLALDEKQKSLD